VCGVAIDVPLIVRVAVLLVDQADVMPTPGANQSTQLPKFAHEAFWSLLIVALTVIAWLTRAGDVLHAFTAWPSAFPFPAAIA
jgi:hypothetical protein